MERAWLWNQIRRFTTRFAAIADVRISTDCILDVSGRVVTFNCARVPEFSGVAEFSEIRAARTRTRIVSPAWDRSS